MTPYLIIIFLKHFKGEKVTNIRQLLQLYLTMYAFSSYTEIKLTGNDKIYSV